MATQKMKIQKHSIVSSSVPVKNHDSNSEDSDTIMDTSVTQQVHTKKKNASGKPTLLTTSLAASRPRRNLKRVVYKDAPDLEEDDSLTEDELRESHRDDEEYASSGFSSSSSLDPSGHSRKSKKARKRKTKKGGGKSRVSKEPTCKRERNKISAANYRKRRKVNL